MFKQFVIALLICFSTTLNGQITVYASTGVNVSNLTFNLGSESDLIFRNEPFVQPFFTLGTAIPISEKIVWFNELSYSPSGYQTKADTFPNPSFKVKYNLINLQSALGYQLGSVRLELGGFAGTSLSVKSKINDRDWRENINILEDVNLGVFAGLNLSVVKNIGLFLRYYKGISPVSKLTLTDINGDDAGFLTEKINNVQLGVTVSLF